MRALVLPLLLLSGIHAHAQRLDPDQNPYWSRYTLVENSETLTPLRGDYRVYYLQSGMWWNMSMLDYTLTGLPKEGIRLLPLFRAELPAFSSTPARGMDLPDVRLVAVRDRDTMVVELTSGYLASAHDTTERCARTDCRRLPPFVLPFRAGRYLVNGAPFGPDGADHPDARTAELTRQFDVLWNKAMKNDAVIPQLNTDTCRYDVMVLEDLDVPVAQGAQGRNTDVWLLRSAYCGTHLAKFPSWGTETFYTITGGPGSGVDTSGHGAQLHFTHDEENKQWLDVTDLPPGDYTVSLIADGNGGSFILKLR